MQRAMHGHIHALLPWQKPGHRVASPPQVMSTEHHFIPGSPQHAWLEADLAAVDRSITPWVVLVGHRWGQAWVGRRGLRARQVPALSPATSKPEPATMAPACRRPIYIDADEYGEQGKQTTAIQARLQQGRCPYCRPATVPMPQAAPRAAAGAQQQLDAAEPSPCHPPVPCAAARRAGGAAGSVRRGCGDCGAPPQARRGGRGLVGELLRTAACSALLPAMQLLACPSDGLLLPSRAPARSYQRTCSVHAGACHPGRSRGTVHLCVGNAGAGFYDNGFAQRPAWIEHEVGGGWGGGWEGCGCCADAMGAHGGPRDRQRGDGKLHPACPSGCPTTPCRPRPRTATHGCMSTPLPSSSRRWMQAARCLTKRRWRPARLVAVPLAAALSPAPPCSVSVRRRC